jgi:uncharacterized protein YjiS (DUF1127 family)
MHLLKSVLLTLRQYREFRAALAELGARPDDELAELGIDRGDIARIAYEEAERRAAASAVGGRLPASTWQGAALVHGR